MTDPKVEFHSEGRVLIIGTGERGTAAASELSDSLSCHLLTDGPTVTPRGVSAVDRHGCRVIVGGHLGAFTVTLEGLKEHPDLGVVVDPERPVFDLVLDLGQEAAIVREWGPPGYFRPRGEAELAGALAELPKLRGRVEKPRFFELNATICAHGIPGIEGCRRCIEVCPAEAITSVDSKIQVDANLCQGGGACATTCPTGAITYRYPERRDTLDQLQRLLAMPRDAGGEEGPVVVFLEERTEGAALAPWPERALPFQVLEVGSVGMGVWFSALAMGASAVRILRGPGLAESIERAIDEQLGFARVILEGLGFPVDAVSWTELASDPVAGQALPVIPAVSSLQARSKRGVLYAALDHLRTQAPTETDVLGVPEGAPFGQLQVSAKACTTCLACAFLCPTRALAGGGGAIPQLLFTEAACVQCGLCEVGCPEKAITLEARLLLPPAERAQPRVLHEDEPFACVSCGKHFAPAGTVRVVSEMLADHPMFTKSGIDLLRTCDACKRRMMN
jgi:ferredoxin